MINEHVPKSIIVIFGATGDLARRKLFPSIYRLYKNGKITEDFAVVGLARRPWTNEILRENVKTSIKDDLNKNENVEEFLSHFYYRSFDVTDTSNYEKLRGLLSNLEEKYHTEGNRIFYLAMAPEFFGVIAHNLKEHGLKSDEGWTRLVIEKPFGTDFQSAKKLNNELRASFAEKEIYRIDHYL